MDRYFEDLEVGETDDLGSETLTEAAIIEFGELWDPLPQHTDREGAADSLPGTLIASGLHTLCVANRLATGAVREELAGSIGLGFSDVRWPASVEPGDEVAFRHEVVGKRPSESDPAFGVVTTRLTGEVEGKGLVLEYDTVALVRRRGADDERGG